MSNKELFIGLMSGTSADGVDAVLMDFSEGKHCLIAHHSAPFSIQLQKTIQGLFEADDNEIERAGALDTTLGIEFSTAVNNLLDQTKYGPEDITAIGSHGQTIRHRPPGKNALPFSWQIGDPNIIANNTNITTVADFRRRDIALEGQGAPLVPAFHAALFTHPTRTRAIVNIGGIANISWLEAGLNTIGFDTGPGNNLMDQWCLQHQGVTYDKGGVWASSGVCHAALLSKLLEHPYFSAAPPKSTGREDFNLNWLNDVLSLMPENIKPDDIQATLLMLTVESIALDIEMLAKNKEVIEVYICGGGARNGYLLMSLQKRLADYKVTTTDELELAPEWIEAAAFAWLARQTIKGLAGNSPSVTGAKCASILGGIYLKNT